MKLYFCSFIAVLLVGFGFTLPAPVFLNNGEVANDFINYEDFNNELLVPIYVDEQQTGIDEQQPVVLVGDDIIDNNENLSDEKQHDAEFNFDSGDSSIENNLVLDEDNEYIFITYNTSLFTSNSPPTVLSVPITITTTTTSTTPVTSTTASSNIEVVVRQTANSTTTTTISTTTTTATNTSTTTTATTATTTSTQSTFNSTMNKAPTDEFIDSFINRLITPVKNSTTAYRTYNTTLKTASTENETLSEHVTYHEDTVFGYSDNLHKSMNHMDEQQSVLDKKIEFDEPYTFSIKKRINDNEKMPDTINSTEKELKNMEPISDRILSDDTDPTLKTLSIGLGISFVFILVILIAIWRLQCCCCCKKS